jgi:hypothetical protein
MRARLACWAAMVALPALIAGCGSSSAGCPPANPGGIQATGAHISADDHAFPAAENEKQGTADWRICDAGAPGTIQGYASAVSVLPGQSFRLYVSTTAPSFRVQAFRMGWYGGDQARQAWESGSVPGRVQAPARLMAATRTVTAPWRPTLTVSTAGWPPGAYLLRLDASTGPERYVPVTVRSPSTAGKVVILEGVTTWQAYNLWGGYDLYSGPRGFADRSYAVSFDRPYDLTGAARFLYFDQPPIALAESTGVPLAYETDVDIDEHPKLLVGARAVVSLGHDEYYSASMRAALLNARNAGTNLAFLGANAMYRRTRFASSPLGRDRIEIAYKVARLDPEYGHDDAATTQNWRDPPDPRPESVITGVFYECNPVSASYVVYDPNSWIFAGTGFAGARRSRASSDLNTTASTGPCRSPNRCRSWPTRRSAASATPATRIPPTTPCAAARACSPPARCAGSARSAGRSAVTGSVSPRTGSSTAPQRTSCTRSPPGRPDAPTRRSTTWPRSIPRRAPFEGF